MLFTGAENEVKLPEYSAFITERVIRPLESAKVFGQCVLTFGDGKL